MDGVKTMRAELGMTQIELAAALHVSFTAVNRWENGKSRPTSVAFESLMRFARDHQVSQGCIEQMESSFAMTRTRQNARQVKVGRLPAIDRELLCQLVEEAETSIYVTDAETDELLYANRSFELALGKSRDDMVGQKCYQFLSNRDEPCPYCHKKQLTRDRFFVSNVESDIDGRLYTARAKVISWNGREAHVRYLTGISNDNILQNVACGICVYTIGENHTLDIRYANDGYYTLCEGTAEELEQAYKADHLFGVCEEYREQIRDFFVRIATTGQNDEITYRCRSLKGSIKWVTARATYVAGDKALRDKIYCTFLDVTSSVANEMQLNSMLAKLPVAMIVFTVQEHLLRLQYISENCVNISGYSAEETYLRNADGLASDAHPDAQRYFLDHDWHDVRQTKNLSYTYPIRCKDGAYRYVILSLAPVAVDGTLLYYGALRSTDYHGPETMMII